MRTSKKNKREKGRSSNSGLSFLPYLSPSLKYGTLVIFLLTLFIYFPKLNHDFTNWDDPIYVSTNDLIRTGSFSEFWTRNVASNYHPLTMLSLSLDYAIFGDNPKGYFIHNILLHVLNTLLLLWIITLLAPGKDFISLFTAGAFALHPLHVESVAWISERKDVLYVFFFFISWLLYIKWEDTNQKKWILLALLAFLLSCLSKGMAVVLPLVLALSTWIRKDSTAVSKYIYLIPFLIISLIFGIVAIITQKQAGALSIDSIQLSYLDRFITALHGYVFYLEKFLIPSGLSAYYPYPVNFNVNWPLRFIIAPLIWIIAGALIFIYKNKHKALVAGALWYCVILLPVSQILSVGNAIAADRYFYLASIGPLFVLGYFLQYGIDKQKYSRLFVLSLFIITGLIWTYLSRTRVQVWQNSISLFTDVISKYPESAVAYHGLGEAYNKQGEYVLALQQFELALKYRPGYPDVLYNTGVVYDDLKQFDKAIPYYAHALKNKPEYIEALYNIANAYYMIQKYDSSLFFFERTLQLKPNHTGALNNMASIFFDIEDFDRALKILLRTLEVNPAQEEAMFNIGSIYFQRREFSEALVWFEKCIRINPGLPDNYRMLGITLAESGRIPEAIAPMQKAAGLGDVMAQQWLQSQGIRP